jgi:beta-lactamase class A
VVTGGQRPAEDAGRPYPARLAALPLPPSADPPGAVSVWCGRLGETPAFTHRPGHGHYAASLMKLPVMVAAYRAHERGDLDLDERVVVRDEVASALTGTFRTRHDYDDHEEPWRVLGEPASLRWLCRRMIVASSNLAANLLLDRLGLEAVAAVTPTGFEVGRPIGDTAAEQAGLTNTVTVAATADLLTGLATGRAAGPAACREMLAVLAAQQYRAEIPAGLPPRTQVANKTGWTNAVRHDAAVVFPADAPPYVLVVCTTGLPDQDARTLIRDVAAATWADRHDLGGREPADGDIGWRPDARR